MFEVAVYHDLLHKQFCLAGNRFALQKKTSELQTWEVVGETEDPQGSIQFRISNTGLEAVALPPETPIHLAEGRPLVCGEPIPLPCVLQLGATWLEVLVCESPRSMAPLLSGDLAEFLSSADPDDSNCLRPSAATVAKWLSHAGQLHRAVAGSKDFYADAARFAVDTVGLNAAWIVSCDNQQWQIVGSCLPSPQNGVAFNSAALEVLKLKPVAWYQPAPTGTQPARSQALVVAPVLDLHGNLTAAVYGVRNTQGNNRRAGVRPLEARLVQLLAESVAAGIARIDQETEATRARVLLEQAFSPTVAKYIQQHPESLAGQLKDVTVLFADLRGYTTLAESLPPADCYAMLGDVMESLTQIVMQHGGVVVDYYGDGLLALWNAPLEQSNHPDLACSAAIELLEAMPDISEKWHTRLNGPLELGIGIHTGPAHVGNAGTRSRLKYGPRGNTVNLASRVQAASKQLQLPLVMTASTQKKLTSKFFTLRACTAKLPGLEKPIELYTAYPASEATTVKSKLDQYSHALDLFETGELESAEHLLSELVKTGPTTPANFLAHYTASQISRGQGRRAVDKTAANSGSVVELSG